MRWATCRIELALAALVLTGCGDVPPPSLLLVTLDTLRRDHVGAYGDARGLTPAFDALAASGLLHEAASTTMPTTAPAHVSLFTGLMPSEHGVRRNGDPLPAALSAREAGTRLRDEAGYATAAFVSTRLMTVAFTGLRGFEVFDAPRSSLRDGADTVEAALAWLDAERRRPVLLWVHIYDAHAPYGTADEKRQRTAVAPGRHGFVHREDFAADAEREAMAARYARGVRAGDNALDTLLTGVRERLESPPLVVVASDHGESLAEHLDERGFAYDHGKYLDRECTDVVLAVAGPGVTPGRSAGAASLRDLYTTLLRSGGLEDALAADEGRRDLRVPNGGRRVVEIERRRFREDPDPSVRTHAAAAFDGRSYAVVAQDGALTLSERDAPADLVRAARARAVNADTTPAARLAPETRDALEALGYAE